MVAVRMDFSRNKNVTKTALKGLAGWIKSVDKFRHSNGI
jgi:hypothetical protein